MSIFRLILDINGFTILHHIGSNAAIIALAVSMEKDLVLVFTCCTHCAASASVAEIQNANPTIAIQLWELTTNSARQKNCAIIGHWLGNSDRKIMTDRWMVSWDSVMSVWLARAHYTPTLPYSATWAPWMMLNTRMLKFLKIF